MIGLRHVSPYFVFFPCHSSHASALLRAPDMSKMEEVAASKPNFTGVWVLVKQSNSDAFLKVRAPRMEYTCVVVAFTPLSRHVGPTTSCARLPKH